MKSITATSLHYQRSFRIKTAVKGDVKGAPLKQSCATHDVFICRRIPLRHLCYAMFTGGGERYKTVFPFPIRPDRLRNERNARPYSNGLKRNRPIQSKDFVVEWREECLRNRPILSPSLSLYRLAWQNSITPVNEMKFLNKIPSSILSPPHRKPKLNCW